MPVARRRLSALSNALTTLMSVIVSSVIGKGVEGLTVDSVTLQVGLLVLDIRSPRLQPVLRQ